MYMIMHMFNYIFLKNIFFLSERMRQTWCECHVSVCLSVFMCGASAMKVNAWTCAPATDRDLDC